MQYIKMVSEYLLLTLIGMIIVVGLGYGGLKMYEYFGPRYENTRRKIFKQTRSYNEGKMQQLSKYRMEYLQSDFENKKIIKSTIQHMFADYKSTELPIRLREFLDEMFSY